MGTRWEVHVWVEQAPGEWRYELVHGGQSFLRAAVAALRFKLSTRACVKVEWR